MRTPTSSLPTTIEFPPASLFESLPFGQVFEHEGKLYQKRVALSPGERGEFNAWNLTDATTVRFVEEGTVVCRPVTALMVRF